MFQSLCKPPNWYKIKLFSFGVVFIARRKDSSQKTTSNNGFVHTRDADGNMCIRIAPSDKVTNYSHVHVYDDAGNLLDSADNIVDRKSPTGYIAYKAN